MSGEDALRAKLARLAAETPGARHRRLEGPDAEALIAAIVAEIDLTVLGRTLDFENARGEVLALDAAGRRLLRLRGLPPGPGAAAAADLMGRPLSGADAPALADLRALLAAFAGDGGALTLRVGRLTAPPDGAEIGCHARTLAEIWSRPGAAPAVPHGAGIAGFVEACAARAPAWLVTEGGTVSAQSPPSPARDRLLRLARSDAPARGSCVVTGVPGAPVLLFRGVLGDQHVLLSYPAAGLQELLSYWRAAAS